MPSYSSLLEDTAPRRRSDRAKPLDAELSALRLSGPARIGGALGARGGRTYGHCLGPWGQRPAPRTLGAGSRARRACLSALPRQGVTTAPAGGADPRGASNIDWRSHHPTAGSTWGSSATTATPAGTWASGRCPNRTPEQRNGSAPPSFYPFTIPNSSFPAEAWVFDAEALLPTPSAISLPHHQASEGRGRAALYLAPSSIASP